MFADARRFRLLAAKLVATQRLPCTFKNGAGLGTGLGTKTISCVAGSAAQPNNLLPVEAAPAAELVDRISIANSIRHKLRLNNIEWRLRPRPSNSGPW